MVKLAHVQAPTPRIQNGHNLVRANIRVENHPTQPRRCAAASAGEFTLTRTSGIEIRGVQFITERWLLVQIEKKRRAPSADIADTALDAPFVPERLAA